MTTDTPPKFEYINAVRGVAILLVVILHVSRAVITGLPDSFSYICAKGAFGVQLFFVASAFTLFLSYSNRVKHEGVNTNYNFFVRRFFRISPMYYAAIAVYIVVFYYIPAYNDGKPLELWKVLPNVLYLNDFIPGAINYLPPGGWSVGAEMIFYCCLPFLFIKIKRINIAVTWFIILAVFAFILKLVIRYLLIRLSIGYQNPENWFLYFWFPNQASVFILGIILFFAVKNYSIKSKITSHAILASSTLLMLLLSYYIPKIDAYYIIPEHIIVSVFFTINIFCLSQHSFWLFNNKITRFLGEISFSVYLIHFLVIDVLVSYCALPADPILRFFTLLLITLIACSITAKITYYFIELKGMKFGKRFIKSNA